MKPTLDLLLRVSTVAGTLALASLLGACGQKGPLFLPAKPPPAPAPAPAKPAQPSATPGENPSPSPK